MICVSDSVKENVSFTAVTTATPAMTSTASFCITSEHSYAARVNSLPDSTMLPASHDAQSEGLKVRDISLNIDDKKILEHGEMLTDKHINFAQRLLKEMFSGINGLQLTVLQGREHKEPTTNSIQILHMNGNHWVCAATTVKGKEVNVYDSSFVSWDQAS